MHREVTQFARGHTASWRQTRIPVPWLPTCIQSTVVLSGALLIFCGDEAGGEQFFTVLDCPLCCRAC